MFWIKGLAVIFFVFVLATLSSGQTHIDDRGEGTVNHDYFAARQSDQLSLILRLVETYHLKPCPHSQGGVYEDMAKGRFDNVKADLTYILERFVNHPTALQLMSPVARALKQPAWPIERFEYALKWYPNHAITLAQYGSYLVEIDNLTAGIEKLELAVSLEPNLVAGYVWLSKAYIKRGDVELANRATQKARELGYKG